MFYKLGWILRQRGVLVTLVGLLAFAGSATVSLLIRIPEPYQSDEFSYLLAADTFAHGRLSNSPHPLWVHFESMFIIQQPTYASKYPPAQGMILAAGQLIGGHPIVGVWMSVGLACAAICWMLLAWVPLRWALLGGLLAAMRTGIFGYWAHSYFGGAVAAAGGSLVFGAVRRIVHRPRVRDVLLMGVGLAVLANSRPFEGLVVSLPVAAILLAWMVGKHGPAPEVSLKCIVLPLLVVLLLTGGAMGFYNLRVTGDAFRFPYQVHEATYAVIPLFLWQRLRPEPLYRHDVIRKVHTDPVRSYTRERLSVRGLAGQAVTRIQRLWGFYLGPALTFPLVMLPWVLRDRWMRFVLLICSVLLLALMLVTWTFEHYAAPATGLVFVLVLQGMRYLRLWQWRERSVGQFLIGAILAMHIVWVIGSSGGGRRVVEGIISQKQHHTLLRAEDFKGMEEGKNPMLETQVEQTYAWHLQRARIVAQLKQDAERHLVIVRHGPQSPPGVRWVYNEANIDNAKVVWAWEMDAAQNRKLIEYFKDRRIWLLAEDQDTTHPTLTLYPMNLSHY